MKKYNGHATNVWYFPEGALNDITKWADGEMKFYDLLEKYDFLLLAMKIYRTPQEAEKEMKKIKYEQIEDYGASELYGEVLRKTRDGATFFGKLALIEKEVPTDKDVWKSIKR
jgi:hypothetical protein